LNEAEWSFIYYTFLASILFISGFFIGRNQGRKFAMEILESTMWYLMGKITRHEFITELNRIQEKLTGRKNGTRKRRG